MASTDTANQAILDRLSGMAGFHPASANLFADWTLDPGDVVTVRQGETNYRLPVYQMDIDWKGKSMVSVKSTGSEKRPTLPAMKRSGYGGRAQTQMEREMVRHSADIDKSNGRLSLWATEEQWDEMAQQYALSGRSEFSVQSDQIQSTVLETGSTAGVHRFSITHEYVYGEKCIYDGSLWRCTNPNGHVGQFSTSDFEQVTSMQSQITQNSGRIALVVDSNGIRRGQIILAINNNESNALIQADQVSIQGNTTLDGVLTVSGGNLICKGEGPGARGTFEADTVEARYIDMDANGIIDTTTLNANVIGNVGSLTLDDGTNDIELTASNMYNLLSGASISGDTLSVSRISGGLSFTIAKSGNNLLISDGTSTITFSKASAQSPTIGGSWSGGVYSVTSDITPASGSVMSTTLWPDIGLNSWTLSGRTITGAYDVGWQTIVGGEARKGGSTGRAGNISVNLEQFLEDAEFYPSPGDEITYDPTAYGYAGAKTIHIICSGGSGSGSISSIGYQRIMSVPSTPPAGYTHLSAMTSAVSSAHGGTYGGYVTFTLNPGGQKYYITVP